MRRDTVAVRTLEPIALRAVKAARRGTSDERATVLRNFASDLRILAALPGEAPLMLGYTDRVCVTADDWTRAARAVAARYNLNLQLREQLTLRFLGAA